MLSRALLLLERTWQNVFMKRNRLSTGLFGFPDINTPTDFINNAHNSISYCNILRRSIKRSYDDMLSDVSVKSNVSPQLILRQLDAISNNVCNVIDVATFCTNVHSDESYRLASAEARNILSDYIHELNNDSSLYAIICYIINNRAHELSREDLIFAKDLKREYEHDGIHLPLRRSRDQEYCRQDVVDLKTLICEAEDNLMKNSTELDYKPIRFGPVSPSDYEDIGHLISEIDPKQVQIKQHKASSDDRSLICSSNKSICSRLITLIHQSHIRKQIWEQSYVEPSENRAVLGRLIYHRQRLANILGYSSYAHKYLAANHVLDTPSKVMNFLDVINDSIESIVFQEVEVLIKLKKELHKKDMLPSTMLHNDSNKIYPWDVSYLIFMHREQSTIAEDNVLEKIRPYLRIDIVLQGLQQICEQLFNLKFILSSPIPSSEAWIKHSYLLHKFYVYNERGEFVGTMFLDLFGRDQKFAGSGHFTLRCGCEKIDMSNMINMQQPVIALTSNYPLYHHQMNAPNSLPFLSLHQLENLYHEWGHALHSLLSKTKYQHLSGTRCPVDYAEVPSHLFEYYARSPEVIATWAKHFISKELVSKDLLIEAFAKKSMFRGLDVQGQVFYSAVDQEIFGENMNYATIKYLGGNPDEIFDLASHTARNTQSKYMKPVSLVDDNHQQPQSSMSLLTHTHFIDYGG